MSSFALQIREWKWKTRNKMHFIVQKVLLDISARIVERSPVGNPELWAINKGRKGKLRMPEGYVGGRFRGNWQYATREGGVPDTPVDNVDPSGGDTISRIARGVGSEPAGYVHVLVNNLPYAVPLEQGWSKQAPAGMVGLAVEEFKGIVDDIANQVKHE